VRDLSCLQHWLEKHGWQLKILQLHECEGAALASLPCAQLQDLLLRGGFRRGMSLSISSRFWGDIAAATKLTSVSLANVKTESQQADVESALTALPDLQQLTWCNVRCDGRLSDSLPLQQLTRLTSLELESVCSEVLKHLGSLTRLQHLRVDFADWALAGCPGLQELKWLRSLQLLRTFTSDIPAIVSELTALEQLHVSSATPTALNRLQGLTGLTQLCVEELRGLSSQLNPLQLPSLQHLDLHSWRPSAPLPLLAGCTQLGVLKLRGFTLSGPGSLVASTMLQHLELKHCSISAADGAAEPFSWQQVFSGPERLPHLTSLQLAGVQPALQQSDIGRLVACCSSLQVLGLDSLQDSSAPALAHLPGLTSLHLGSISDQLCSSLVQLSGLRELTAQSPWGLSTAGFKQLASLEQLTSLACTIRLNCGRVGHELQALMSDRLQGYRHAVINQV